MKEIAPWWTFLAVQQLGLQVPSAGVWVQSLVGKIRSTSHVAKKKVLSLQVSYSRPVCHLPLQSRCSHTI